MSIEWVTMTGQAVLIDHVHQATHLLAVIEGEIHEDGRIYQAGDIRISPAADRHFLRFGRRTRCLILAGDVPSVPRGRRRVLRMPVLTGQLVAAKEADEVVALVGGRAVADALADWELPAWLHELERRRNDGTFLRARSVTSVARMAGVSREHLARCYRSSFGTSVGDALRMHRLRTAYDAVTRSSVPLADIADACGFADQSHMTRRFTEWIGRAPGTLRRGQPDITSVQDTPRQAGV